MLNKHLETSCKTETKSANHPSQCFAFTAKFKHSFLCLSCFSYSVGLYNLETDHFCILLHNGIYRGYLQFYPFPFFLSLNSSIHITMWTHIWCTFTVDLFSTFHSTNCFTQTHTVGDPVSGMMFKPSETKGQKRKRKEGEGQFELEFGQSSNVFPGCLHGLIKSSPLAQALVATRGGLWCHSHGFPAGQTQNKTTTQIN